MTSEAVAGAIVVLEAGVVAGVPAAETPAAAVGVVAEAGIAATGKEIQVVSGWWLVASKEQSAASH
jgi:hypothetical protein